MKDAIRPTQPRCGAQLVVSVELRLLQHSLAEQLHLQLCNSVEVSTSAASEPESVATRCRSHCWVVAVERLRVTAFEVAVEVKRLELMAEWRWKIRPRKSYLDWTKVVECFGEGHSQHCLPLIHLDLVQERTFLETRFEA